MKLFKSKSKNNEVEFLREVAVATKIRFEGKIPKNSFLVLKQNVDMGDVIAGVAGEEEQFLSGFQDALKIVVENDLDDQQILLLDDYANLCAISVGQKVWLLAASSQKIFHCSQMR